MTSTFDTGTDGWQVETVLFMGEYPPTVILTLTPRRCCREATRAASSGRTTPMDHTVFVAPSEYLGPKLDYLGDTLSFSLRDAFNDGIQDNLVALVGDDRTLFAKATIPRPTYSDSSASRWTRATSW